MLNQAKKKIGVLITAGYALALVLVVALGLLAIVGMDSLRSISLDIYAHPFRVTNAVLEAKASITQARDRALLVILLDDPGQAEQWMAEMARFDRDAKERLDGVKDVFTGDIRQLEKAEALLREWQGVRDRAIESARRGRRGEATHLVMEASLALFARLTESMDLVIGVARQKAASFVGESEARAVAETNRIVWFLAGLMAVIGFGGRAVQRRVMAMVRCVEQLERDLLLSQYQAESAAYARSLIEASLDPLVTISLEGKITDANRAAEQVTGAGREELVGTDFADYFTEPGKAREGYQQVFQQGFVTDYPLAIRHKDGHVADVLYNASVYRDEAGTVLGVFAAARDVTRRKQVEEALAASEREFRLLAEAMPQIVWVTRADGWVTYFNQQWVDYTGLTLEESYGHGWNALFHPDDQRRAWDAWQNAVSNRGAYSLECRLRRRDGEYRWWLIRSVPVLDGEGNVGKWFGTCTDIDDIKRAEGKVRESEKKFKAMTDTSPLAIYMSSGVEQKAEYINPRFTELFGYTLEEVPSVAQWWPLAYPDEAYRRQVSEEWQRKVEQAIENNSSIEPMEVEVTCKDGSKKHVSWGYISTGVQNWAFGLDLTERKRAEDALREKEERLALATLKNGVGVWDWNLQTQKMIWDDSMYELYHIRREDFSGTEQAWRAALHPDDLERGDREVEDAIAGRKPFETEFRVVWPNGEIHHIKAVAKVFRDEQGAPLRMLGINMDITERKQAEARLAASESRLRAIIETEPECIKVVDAGGCLRQMNPAGLAMIEADSFEQVAGQAVVGLIAPAYRQSFARMHERVIAGEPQRMEYVMIGLKGRPLWLETHAVPMPDGDEVVHLAVTRDISERKRAEEQIRQINAELEQRIVERTAELEAANKELEAFSYSVSHDLRTPLRAIDGFSLMLLEDYADALDEEGKRLLNVVRNNTSRMSQLIDDILRFSRAGRTELSFAEVDMEKVVSEVLEELEPVLAGCRPDIRVGSLPHVQGDRAMLRQAIGNLISNAIKFSSKKEDARIDIGGRVEDGNAVYHVKDNGVGFDMQYVGKLFGVFQRLHGVDEYEGTGIGLAIVKRVAARHGGRVWAEGEVGKGAAFYFSIPLKERRNG